MSSFEPFIYAPKTPRSGGIPVQQASQPAAAAAPATSVVYSVNVSVDLSQIQRYEPLVAGQMYSRDYFLAHVYDAVAERLVVSASAAVQQFQFAVMLVAKDGQKVTNLTDVTYFKTLPTQATEIDLSVEQFTGAIYLRISTVSQETEFFATLELLTTQVF
jgi:hypothetical protein